MSALSDLDRAVIALARRNWPDPYHRDRVIREQLGLAPVRFFQRLNALLDDPDALAHDPVTINRLWRARENKRAIREGAAPPYDRC